MAQALKPFTDYIESWPHSGTQTYSVAPGSEFLKQILDIVDANTQCRRHFPKKKNGDFTAAGDHSITQIAAGCLCTMMGHFELYQRFTFAGVVEYSIYLEGFDLSSAIRRLEKDSNVQISTAKLLAYRGSFATAGQLIVDSLPGWHDPERVNRYLKAFLPKLNYYSNDEIDDLRILWQLRHTMAHAGGWLSIPDAQKVSALNPHKDHALFMKSRFIEAAVRRFHRIAPSCTRRLKDAFDEHVSPQFSRSKRYNAFFNVTSPRRSWL